MNSDFWVIDASCGVNEDDLWKEQSVSNEAKSKSSSKLKHSWAGNFVDEFVNVEINRCNCPANCEKNHTKLLGLRYFNSRWVPPFSFSFMKYFLKQRTQK